MKLPGITVLGCYKSQQSQEVDIEVAMWKTIRKALLALSGDASDRKVRQQTPKQAQKKTLKA